MSQTTQAIEELHQQSVLQQAAEERLRSERMASEADKELLEIEADIAWLEKRQSMMMGHQDEISAEMTELKKSWEVKQELQYLFQLRQQMLADLHAFASGERFQTGNSGARFFTSTAQDMAHRFDIGELQLQKLTKSSKDGASFEYKKNSYWFLTNASGQSFFHPNPVDLQKLEHHEEKMN